MKLEVTLNTQIDIFCIEYKRIIYDLFDYAWSPPGDLPGWAGMSSLRHTHHARSRHQADRPYKPSGWPGRNTLLHMEAHHEPLSLAMYCVALSPYVRIYLVGLQNSECRVAGLSTLTH